MEKIIVFISICLSVDFVLGRQVSVPRNKTETNDEEDFVKELPVCHYDDPKVTDCIQRAAEQARVFLAHGIPSLGIQPLEPLRVPNLRLRQRNAPNKGFKYDAWFSDVVLDGLTDYSFNSLDVFPEEMKVTANISLPRLHMTGEFLVLGHFQMLPVESMGKITANFTMCTAALEAVGARVHKRMVVRDATVHLRCKGPINADLTDAHSASGDMVPYLKLMLKVLNVKICSHLLCLSQYQDYTKKITDHIVGMHSAEIIAEVQPAVETTLAMVLEDVANKFLKHIPYDMVFPN